MESTPSWGFGSTAVIKMHSNNNYNMYALHNLNVSSLQNQENTWLWLPMIILWIFTMCLPAKELAFVKVHLAISHTLTGIQEVKCFTRDSVLKVLARGNIGIAIRECEQEITGGATPCKA